MGALLGLGNGNLTDLPRFLGTAGFVHNMGLLTNGSLSGEGKHNGEDGTILLFGNLEVNELPVGFEPGKDFLKLE